MRIGAAQLTSWKARLGIGDGDLASALLDAVEPLYHLPYQVELGRRRLAAHYAAAVERRLSTAVSRAPDRRDETEARALVARLRRLAGV